MREKGRGGGGGRGGGEEGRAISLASQTWKNQHPLLSMLVQGTDIIQHADNSVLKLIIHLYTV